MNDRTKATCIRWLPKSLNLFLVSHSSGHMYLYDIDLNQAQSSSQSQHASSGPYQVISEGDGFKIETNVSIVKSSKVQNQNDSLNGKQAVQLAQQQQNPLIKWTITTVNKDECSINEFAFSPDAQHLAIVCQDGYLRVFNYAEMQLKCKMKSYFGGLLCVSWSHDGKYIATGGEDDLITVYSFHEQRVACRGKGHSSWVNCVQFDYWTSNYLNDLMKINEDDGDSDFEEYHQNKNAASKAPTKKTRKHSVSLSSTQNKRYSSLSDYDQVHILSKINIYRLGSIGQDNRIAFWDLNEDVLREKTHLRSRVTSIAFNSLNISNTSQPPSHAPNEVEPQGSIKTTEGDLQTQV
jgi:WD40 repeat protein